MGYIKIIPLYDRLMTGGPILSRRGFKRLKLDRAD